MDPNQVVVSNASILPKLCTVVKLDSINNRCRRHTSSSSGIAVVVWNRGTAGASHLFCARIAPDQRSFRQDERFRVGAKH